MAYKTWKQLNLRTLRKQYNSLSKVFRNEISFDDFCTTSYDSRR